MSLWREVITLVALGGSLIAMPAQADTPPNPAIAGVVTESSGAKSGFAPASSAGAVDKAGSPRKAAPAPADKGWTLFGSVRVRFENQNFFPTPKANGAYSYVGEAVRVGVQRQTKKEDYLIELEAPGLFNLPTRAIASAPQGQLGHGATYRAINRGQVASLFLKQAYLRVKDFVDPASSLKLGRFDFNDGQETISPDSALNWIKVNRIGQRLLGPFGFTIVTRSYDGVQFVHNTPRANVTAMGVFPTRGAFDLNGWDSLSDIRVFYLSGTIPHTAKSNASDARLFYIYYEDARRGDIKTDNRPAAVRARDRNTIRVNTFGGHYARVMNAGPGKADVMFWGAGQWGQWGTLTHGAYAMALEAGYQLPKTAWKPWLRAAYYLGSGDGNAADKQHGTFFPILPTARIYARYPFFAETNLQDIFGQLILRPNSKLTLRSDIHCLRLADSKDLWYSGGGASNNSSFGYTGRPTSGKGDLATLLDLSGDYQLTRSTALTLYAAYANGGNAVGNLFKSRDSLFGYAEVNYKF